MESENNKKATTNLRGIGVRLLDRGGGASNETTEGATRRKETGNQKFAWRVIETTDRERRNKRDELRHATAVLKAPQSKPTPPRGSSEGGSLRKVTA